MVMVGMIIRIILVLIVDVYIKELTRFYMMLIIVPTAERRYEVTKMTKAEIIDYLYTNNVRGDFSIEQMAEDLERPRGEWTNAGVLTVHCSNCKSEFHELEAMNYCPNCGARMKWRDNE